MGSRLYLGPATRQGVFVEVIIKEIQRSEVKVYEIREGQIGTLAVEYVLNRDGRASRN